MEEGHGGKFIGQRHRTGAQTKRTRARGGGTKAGGKGTGQENGVMANSKDLGEG